MTCWVLRVWAFWPNHSSQIAQVLSEACVKKAIGIMDPELNDETSNPEKGIKHVGAYAISSGIVKKK